MIKLLLERQYWELMVMWGLPVEKLWALAWASEVVVMLG